jgi:hypothetical protein
MSKDGSVVNNELRNMWKKSVTERRALWFVFLTEYYSNDQIKKNEMGGACGNTGDRRGAYRVLVGKPEGKRPPGRHRLRWDDNIKMDVKELGWEVWTGLIWLRIGKGCELL